MPWESEGDRQTDEQPGAARSVLGAVAEGLFPRHSPWTLGHGFSSRLVPQSRLVGEADGKLWRVYSF